MSDTKIDEAMLGLWSKWAGEKIKKMNILNQNGANLTYIHGQDIAKKLGLETEQRDNITPFPSTTNIAVVEQDHSEPQKTNAPSNTGSSGGAEPSWAETLKKKFLPLALTLATGAGIGGLGIKYLMPPTTENVEAVAVEEDDGSGEVGLDIE